MREWLGNGSEHLGQDFSRYGKGSLTTVEIREVLIIRYSDENIVQVLCYGQSTLELRELLII